MLSYIFCVSLSVIVLSLFEHFFDRLGALLKLPPLATGDMRANMGFLCKIEGIFGLADVDEDQIGAHGGLMMLRDSAEMKKFC